MDPYYQQGPQPGQMGPGPQSQPPPQVGGQPGGGMPMGVPSAPPMQPQMQVGGQSHHHSSQSQSQAQQQQMIQSQSSGHHQSSHRSGGGGGYSSSGMQPQPGQMQQPQPIQSYGPQSAMVGDPSLQAQHQQQQQQASQSYGQRGQMMNGGHHSSGGHHGGQAPLPPHHSSGRYGQERASHRSTMMHQHRSSAAAISDPMMAGGITDHLASASGPMTGSGSALNQLGMSGYGGGGYGGGVGGPYGAGYDPNLAAGSGGYLPPPSGQHQSRYDMHHGGGSSSHRSRAHASASGAYHLDRADLLADRYGGSSGAYPTSQMHQSLGNLPSATSRLEQRYGLGEPSLGLGPTHHTTTDRYGQPAGYLGASGLDPLGGLVGGRSGSMPPLSSLDGAGLGLGAYNPLDDPLAAHQMHQPFTTGLTGSAYGAGGVASHHYPRGGATAPMLEHQSGGGGGMYPAGGNMVTELRARLQEMQNNYATVKRELETATQKLGSSMHSIKSFWSPELKKERALRKEEATKYQLINDQMKLMRVEVQKQALLIRQLEEELKLAHETQRIRANDPDISQHIDALCSEKESLFRDNCMLKDTIRELEMRIETQKQTLAAREDSTKRLVEMINNKGIATKIMEDERLEYDRVKSRNIDLENKVRHYETIIEARDKDLVKPSTSKSSEELDTQDTLEMSKSSSLEREDSASSSSSSSASSTNAKTDPIPKSPVARQRTSVTRSSRTERLRSRLQQSTSGSNLSLSSSSGVSSSKSMELRDCEMPQTNSRQQPEVCPRAGDFKLCDCLGCTAAKSSSSSNNKNNNNNGNYYSNLKLRSLSQEARAPTPPKSSAASVKKAVSFRSSVEHIGSPSCRPLNDLKSMASTLMELMAGQPNEQLDSCDSLHVTKDNSSSLLLQFDAADASNSGGKHALNRVCHAFASRPIKTMDNDQQAAAAAMATTPKQVNEHVHDHDDYLRPLDCSTPKGYILQQQHQHALKQPAPHHQVGGASWLPAQQNFGRQPAQPSGGGNFALGGDNRLFGPIDNAPNPNEQLIQVEIHRPSANFASNPNYTCLCSPDFMCIHNGYPATNAATKVQNGEANSRSNNTSGKMIAARPTPVQMHANELYGNMAAVLANQSDFPLSQDCIECKNLSTYVNLSQTPAKTTIPTPERQQAPLQQSVNGYDSGDYKTLIRKQSEVYGNIGAYGAIGAQVPMTNNRVVIRNPNQAQNANLSLEEPSHYLAEARRLQQTIKDCEMCNEHLVQNGADGLYQCNCQRQQQANNMTIRSQQQQQLAQDYMSPSTTNSYHTALSSSLQPNGQTQLDSSSSLAMINASKLSVLPVDQSIATTSGNQLHQRRTQSSLAQMDHFNGMMHLGDQRMMQMSSNNNNNQNVDSSLSSLFVYRHMSDDNSNGKCNQQFDCDFDPDSLEIQPADEQPQNVAAKTPKAQMLNKQRANHKAQQSAPTPATSASSKFKPNSCTSWLKGRPKCEYISLSSTTSTETKASGATTNSKKSAKSNQQASSSFAVQPDVTQSSLAKRRQLSNSLQQKQQQQQQHQQSTNSAKRKLLSSRANSRSSPNLAVGASNNQSQANNKAQHSRSTSSSAKSIYQCVKNHLRDITKSSSSSQTNLKSLASASTNANAKGSSVSLPRGSSLGVASSTSVKSRATGKAAQMDEMRTELVRREQELLTMGAKMKALEDQLRDSQRHIRVLKDSLTTKEEHYNLLMADHEELRRNLDERNKLIEKRSYQQTFGGPIGGGGGKSSTSPHVAYQEVQELQQLLELRDRKINELQRKVAQLDNLLADREAQLDRARMRLEHLAATGGHSTGEDVGLLNHLEETLGDKEKQISLLKNQRDRAEQELGEERDSHERSIKEYKMKLNSVKFEMDKLQNRLNGSCGGKADAVRFASDTYASGPSGGSDSSLVKRLEMEKRSLQLEVDRLRDRLESTTSVSGYGSVGKSRAGGASSATGELMEIERLQEQLEAQKQELRRAQAECRMNEMERKRSQEEADKLSERYERAQTEMHKLKAKMENATSEREQLLEDYQRQQQMISKCQQERDCALADINQVKIDNDRLQQQHNRLQLECEKLQNQLKRSQNELREMNERLAEQTDEMRKVQQEKMNSQRELKKLTVQLESHEMSQSRLQQEKDLHRNELEKLRERHQSLELEMEKFLHDKELNNQQVSVYKERLEQHQQLLAKSQKEKEQMSLEVHELRERLHKQQKLQDSAEHETRTEVRQWKDKYERLLVQFEKLNDDMAAKQKESQMILEKFQRYQSEAVKLETKLEQSEIDREKLAIELERQQQMAGKFRDEHKKWQEEVQSLQEMYTKTNTKLLKLTEIEERLRIEYDKCQMDLEVLRERYDRLQGESRKLQSERDRLQVICSELERQPQSTSGIPKSSASSNLHGQQAQVGGPGSTGAPIDELQRISSELERSLVKLEQYQREINKLQLEKERLLLDSKASLQQTEQQFQHEVLRMKSNEEKLAMELDRTRMQLEKVQSKQQQTNVDQEKLLADKERLQQQLLLLQQEVDKFRNQQNNSVEETKRLHEDNMQRVLQELETIKEKYTQQRKELLQLRELQQNHEMEKEMSQRELESAKSRLEKLNQTDAKQREDSERCLIELEKMKDKIERKQQELSRAQQERNQFAQEIQVLHKQIQQIQVEYEQLQRQLQSQQPQQQQQQQQQPQVKPEEFNKLKQILVKSEAELQKEKADNKQFQAEVENLKSQLDEAADYIRKVEEDNKMVAKQNQEILQQLNQKQQQQTQQQQQQQQQQQPQQQQQKNQEEMRMMQDVIKKSANEIQKLVEERNNLQEVNKELQRNLEQAKVHFTNTIKEYETELTRLEEEAKKQQASGSQQQPPAAAQQPASDEYKVKFEKAVEAIRAFQKTSDDMKKEIIKLNERNKALSDQNQSLIQSLKSAEDNLRSKNPNEQQQAGAGSREADEMRKQVVQLSELCNTLQKDLQKTNEEGQRQLQTSQQLKAALEKSQSELGNLKTERDRFQQQLEKLMVELERREGEMAKLRQQQDKSGQNIQADQNKLVAFQKQLEEREKQLEAKREELQNFQKQLQQQQQQQPNQQQQQQQPNQQQQEVINKLQQQVKSLEEERNKLRVELETVRKALNKSQEELERLLKILTASEEEKFNLTQQIEQLQNRIKSMAQPPVGGQQQPPPGRQQQQQPQQAPRAPQGQQQGRPGPPPPQQQQQGPRPQGPPQQQRGPPQGQPQQPQPQQQQQRPPNPGQQKPSGPGGFISGFFQ